MYAEYVASLILLAFASVFVMWQSTWFTTTGSMIVFFRFDGTWSHTVVNGDYFNKEQENIYARNGNVTRGLGNAGLAFALWPLYVGFRVPTEQFDVPIHAGEMLTSANHPMISRVRLRADVQLQIRLSTNPSVVGGVIPIYDMPAMSFLIKAKRDLTLQRTLKDHGVDRYGKDVEHTHEIPHVACIFHRVLNQPVIEAMRSASTYFTISTMPIDLGDHVVDEETVKGDIILRKREFERQVKGILVDEEDQVFRQAGLLNPDGSVGLSLTVCNLVVPEIGLQSSNENDSEAMKAMDGIFIARQEGTAAQIREFLTRKGQAEGIDFLRNTLGLDDAQAAFMLDVFRSEGKEVNLNQFGISSDMLNALRDALSNSRPQPRQPEQGE